MKKNILLVFFFFISFSFVKAQDFGPQILILTPINLSFEDSFQKAITQKNKLLKTFLNDISKNDLASQPKNIQRSLNSQIEYSKDLDFSKHVSLIAHEYLFYKFYEKFKNLEIILSKSNKGEGDLDFKNIDNPRDLQYVLNFSKIKLYKKEGVNYSKISVQLFDFKSNSLLIEKDFIGNWTNPGFEFSCEDKSIDCCINNALKDALKQVFQKVYLNNPSIIEEQKLAKDRYDILMNRFYTNPSDLEFLNGIITKKDSFISLSNLYQVEINESKNKFVGFFVEEAINTDFKTLKEKNNDKSIQILRSENSSFEDIPKIYAYALKGVYYNEKWYYEKYNATYFSAKDLNEAKQQYYFNIVKWNFFKEKSSEFNQDFWETNLFSKVIDSNNQYFGLYDIVVKDIKKEKKFENEAFNEKISRNVLIPFYDEQVKVSKNSFSDYVLMYDKPKLIYPKEKEFILTPILVSNENNEKEIRYFLIFTKDNSIYEWIYFKPEKMPDDTWHYGSKVFSQLNKLTKWTFGFSTLDDEIFWNKYVLEKKSDTYKYLRKMNH